MILLEFKIVQAIHLFGGGLYKEENKELSTIQPIHPWNVANIPLR